MILNLGDYQRDAQAVVWFTTQDAAGAAVAPSSIFEVADFKIYKDSSDVQRTSQAGWTYTNVDSIVGLHRLVIDLSDNTDAGFYSARADFAVVLDPDETIDGQIVVASLAVFSIENRPVEGVVRGAAVGTPTTSVIDTDLTDNVTDMLVGRTLIFLSGTQRNEATDITAFNATSKELTVTTMTAAVLATDEFVIV